MSSNTLAQTPPMGWNSWDCYGAAVNESIVRQNAAFMAKNLKSYGWEYIVVDIQWYEPRSKSHEYNAFAELDMDEYSRLIPAANRFPSAAGEKGFKPLADYVHSLGLKFGIHILRGIPRQAVHRNTPILGLLTNSALLDIARLSRNSRLLFRNQMVHKETIGWYTEQKDGVYYIALLNAGEATEKISVNFGDYDLPARQTALDIWTGETVDIKSGIVCDVNPHGVRLFKLSL